MGAARWVVIGTALVAAATAFHMLMSPTDPSRPAARSIGDEPNRGTPDGAAPDGPPQEELDADSRDAMRDFLRQAAQDGE